MSDELFVPKGLAESPLVTSGATRMRDIPLPPEGVGTTIGVDTAYRMIGGEPSCFVAVIEAAMRGSVHEAHPIDGSQLTVQAIPNETAIFHWAEKRGLANANGVITWTREDEIAALFNGIFQRMGFPFVLNTHMMPTDLSEIPLKAIEVLKNGGLPLYNYPTSQDSGHWISVLKATPAPTGNNTRALAIYNPSSGVEPPTNETAFTKRLLGVKGRIPQAFSLDRVRGQQVTTPTQQLFRGKGIAK